MTERWHCVQFNVHTFHGTANKLQRQIQGIEAKGKRIIQLLQ